MPGRVTQHPITNSPYYDPNRHSILTRTGSRTRTAEIRRRSGYFMPVRRARRQAVRRLGRVTEWTLSGIRKNSKINESPAKVQPWRRRGYSDVTPRVVPCSTGATRVTPTRSRSASERRPRPPSTSPRPHPSRTTSWIRNELDTSYSPAAYPTTLTGAAHTTDAIWRDCVVSVDNLGRWR